MSGPTQHAEARNAEMIEPALAAKVAREPPSVRLGGAGAGAGQQSSEDAVMPAVRAWSVPRDISL